MTIAPVKSATISGRLAGLLVLAVCVTLVATAFTIRSSATSHVRAFWTAPGAALIQRAENVSVRRHLSPAMESSGAERSSSSEQNISSSPGLIHVRATLVEDRYYEWSTLEQLESAELNSMVEDSSVLELRFSGLDEVDGTKVFVDLRKGWVTNPQTGRRVKLIQSSCRALEAYFGEILK